MTRTQKKKLSVTDKSCDIVKLVTALDDRFQVPVPSNEDLVKVQERMLEMPQTLVSVDHFIHAGMYSRTIMIQAGVVLIGAAMNNDSVCISSGDITVTTDDGVHRFTGYHVIPALAGKKRVGLAHQDTYWTSVFRSNASTVEEAEMEMTNEYEKLQTRVRLCQE